MRIDFGRFTIALMFFSAAGAWAQKPLEHRDIAYTTADTVTARLDVYENTTAASAPVLVYFHGGAWTTGARPKAASSFRAFLELGFSVVSVDYRMSGIAPAPAALQDARCALAWVKKNAARYHFDASRVVVYGTSAGGQLALMTAMLPASARIDDPSCRDVPTPAAILDYYGPADVMAFAAKSANTRKWLGEGAHADSMAHLMSPLDHVRPGLPPTLIVHGDADPTVPHEQSERLLAALTNAGVPARLHTVPGGQHGKFSPEQTADIMKEVADFLRPLGLVR